MNEILSWWVLELGRTTLFLAVATVLAAVVLRLARPASPRVHRAAWCLVLLVGWLLVRMPVSIPWYDPPPGATAGLRRAQSSRLPSSASKDTKDTKGDSPIFAAQKSGQSPSASDDTETIIEISEQPPWRDTQATQAETNESLLSGSPSPPLANPAESAAATPVLDAPASEGDSPIFAAPSAPQESGQSPGGVSWKLVLFVAWIAGLCVALLRWLAGYVRSIRCMSTALLPDEATLRQWRALLAEHKINHDIPLRLTTDMGPLLCRWPDGYELVVPAKLWESLGPAARLSIMRHELAHYQRGDVWKSLAARVLALPHWFNPAAWWAVRRFEEAAEWACDEAAVAGGREQTDYARALLVLAESSAGGGSCHPAASRWNLSARVRRLLSPSNVKDSIMKKAILLVMALALVALCLIRIDLVAKTPDDEEPPGATGVSPVPSPKGDSPIFSPPAAPKKSGQSPGATAGSPSSETKPPHEGTMISLPSYRIEPPDVVQIEIMKMVPKPPYRIGTWDVLQVNVLGTLVDQPINDDYRVEADGTFNLGPAYGRVKVGGLTVEEAEKVVTEHLMHVLRKPQVAIVLARAKGYQPVTGSYLVAPDGTINLRKYGTIHVAGKTIAKAKKEIDQRLSKWFGSPDVTVDVAAYNSKVYYIVVRSKKQGDSVVRVPSTGKETVLDAIAQLRGLRVLPDTKIWVARPKPGGRGKDTILPVDFDAVARGENTTTNYQLMPGDRVFISGASLVGTKEPLVSIRKAKGDSPILTPQEPGRSRKNLRYQDRSFDQWKTSLDTELSPDRRFEAIRAMAAFGARGYGREAADVIAKLMREHGGPVLGHTVDQRLLAVAVAAFSGREVEGVSAPVDMIPLADGVPVLCRELKEGNEKSRGFALHALDQLGPKASAATATLAAFIVGEASACDTTRMIPFMGEYHVNYRQWAIRCLAGLDPAGKAITAVLRAMIAKPEAQYPQTLIDEIMGKPTHMRAVDARWTDVRPGQRGVVEFLADCLQSTRPEIRRPALLDLAFFLADLDRLGYGPGNMNRIAFPLSKETLRFGQKMMDRLLVAYEKADPDQQDRVIKHLRGYAPRHPRMVKMLQQSRQAVQEAKKKGETPPVRESTVRELYERVSRDVPEKPTATGATSSKGSTKAKPTAEKPSKPGARVGVSIDRVFSSGQPDQVVGRTISLRIAVDNDGSVPLTKVKIECVPNKRLRPTQATEGFQRDGERLIWTIDSLPAGRRKTFLLDCGVVEAAEMARCRVVVTTAEGVRAEDEFHFEIPEPAKKLVPVDGGTSELSPSSAEAAPPHR